MQIHKSPLRVFEPLLDDAEVAAAIAGGEAERKAAEAKLGPGFPVGDPKRHMVIAEDGSCRGLSEEEPEDAHIDTGLTVADFRAGERVWIWWWDYWWQATVQHVATRMKTLTVRWAWSNAVTSGYLPRLCKKRE